MGGGEGMIGGGGRERMVGLGSSQWCVEAHRVTFVGQRKKICRVDVALGVPTLSRGLGLYGDAGPMLGNDMFFGVPEVAGGGWRVADGEWCNKRLC